MKELKQLWIGVILVVIVIAAGFIIVTFGGGNFVGEAYRFRQGEIYIPPQEIELRQDITLYLNRPQIYNGKEIILKEAYPHGMRGEFVGAMIEVKENYCGIEFASEERYVTETEGPNRGFVVINELEIDVINVPSSRTAVIKVRGGDEFDLSVETLNTQNRELQENQFYAVPGTNYLVYVEGRNDILPPLVRVCPPRSG